VFVAPRIRLLCLDVDGVLTDGSISISDRGEETKRFHVRDGFALRLWRRLGGEVAVITGRSGLALRHRLEELGIGELVNGSVDKGRDFDRLLGELGVAAAEVAMVGDDLPDLPALLRCGYPIATADAVAEVRAVAAFVTAARGGQGAVREAVEHLLRRDGRWDEALAAYRPVAAGTSRRP